MKFLLLTLNGFILSMPNHAVGPQRDVFVVTLNGFILSMLYRGVGLQHDVFVADSK